MCREEGNHRNLHSRGLIRINRMEVNLEIIWGFILLLTKPNMVGMNDIRVIYGKGKCIGQ